LSAKAGADKRATRQLPSMASDVGAALT